MGTTLFALLPHFPFLIEVAVFQSCVYNCYALLTFCIKPRVLSSMHMQLFLVITGLTLFVFINCFR